MTVKAVPLSEDIKGIAAIDAASGARRASSVERLPIETVIVSAIKAFKQIPLDTVYARPRNERRHSQP